MLPYKFERSNIFWYRVLHHLKCQIEETCTTLQQAQQFTEFPQYSHPKGMWMLMSTEDATVILPRVLLVSQTHCHRDRCHTRSCLKFYTWQMQKVSEENANLLNNRRFFQIFWVSRLSLNPSQGPKASSLESTSSVAVCLAGLLHLALRQPAMPEVSGSLPRSLELEGLACTISASRALYVEQRESLEDVGLTTRSWGSQAAPGRMWGSRHLCQLWDCL